MLGNLGLFASITEIHVSYDLAPSASTPRLSSRLSSRFSSRLSRAVHLTILLRFKRLYWLIPNMYT